MKNIYNFENDEILRSGFQGFEASDDLIKIWKKAAQSFFL